MAPYNNHHENIGEGTLLADIATRGVECLSPEDTVGTAARIMVEKRISSIVVTDGERHPIGIVTESNMLHVMQRGSPPDTPLRSVMFSPVIAVPKTMTCIDGYQICLRDGIRHMVVVDDDKVLEGIVSETDFRQNLNLAVLAGRRQVASTMTRSVFSLPTTSTLSDVLLLMQSHRDTCVVVVEENRPVGIITERDIVRLYTCRPDRTDVPVSEVMSSPVLSIPLDNTINEAANMMLDAKVRHLVVVNDTGCLAGLLSEHDLTQAMALSLIDDKLVAEGAFLHTLMNTIPDMVWIKNVGGVYLACNPAFEKFLGIKEAEIIGRKDRDLFETDLANCFSSHDTVALEKDGPVFVEEWCNHGGDHILLDVLRTPMRNSQQKLIGILGIARDITGRKHAEEALRITASVFDNSQEAIIITDPNNMITDVNPAFSRITGYSRDEVIGRNPKLLSSGYHDQDFYAGMWQTLQKNKVWRGEVWDRRKSGEVYAGLLSISAICGADGKVQRYVSMFSDISHLKAEEAKLSRLAHYDTLTGVPNRILLADRLQQAIVRTQRSGKMLAVCYMDLDGFKQINDTYGHRVGDLLLMDMAQRLPDALRADDTIARLGGDEFAMLLNDLSNEEECYNVLQRVLDIIAKPVVIDRHEISISTSIGVTFYPADNADGDTLLRHADKAMYAAKREGKNRYHRFVPKNN